jgi:hypothetical protein
VVGTLHRIAESGPGSQDRKLDLLAGRRQPVPKQMIGARASAPVTPLPGSRS